MKILILGGDGYLGWPTAMYFSRKGYEVAVLDNFNKRKWEMEMGIKPLPEVATLHERIRVWKDVTGKDIKMYVGDLVNTRFVHKVFEDFRPDAIVHYGEQPSAPFSMSGNEQAIITQTNNVIGNLNVLFAIKKHCPHAHLVKLGTMGEYGTPNIDIEEGYLDVEHKGRKDRVLFPKRPGSFYHLSKVHDSNNIYFAVNTWNLRATDLNQGVVYGIETEETLFHEKLCTSFHYDEIFGTALNRFCVQAIAGLPITPYGKGEQKRAFLNILDTLQCVELAVLNPSEPGEFKIYNQFTETFSINQLAMLVQESGKKFGLDVKIMNIENPRKEMETHYFNPVHTKFIDLGLKPQKLSDVLVDSMLKKIIEYKDNIDKDTIMPKVKWEQSV
ncbi:MAG: NAD-dependent dehydratase [Candidatus Magasanikbacteria bacterium CG10_big_fil_rev_8_21_14_0_10_38_6]|uniref:NAD-dependent dehydratase n=1 Tax=Candidatus Magasanikbacteria bacterium CG10_big_fil_rev_8_21_14_0_10_38_6 TaxID=1974647 RepID=A0A2M6P159_9BACT|nr:MAG: NAD-dependent dehydratase [Candidatus Magasanikbacteria bacterium CG10_big_fil_rev_8_21_14_0_10_38_6]